MSPHSLDDLLREKDSLEKKIDKAGNDFFIIYGLVHRLDDVKKHIEKLTAEKPPDKYERV